MYYNSKKKLIILAIYKTASTTLYHMIDDYARDEHTEMVKGSHYSIDSYLELKNLKFDDVRVIFGVRNPWDLISSFYHAHIRMNVVGDTLENYSLRTFLETNQGKWRRVIERWEIDRVDDVIIFEQLRESLNHIGKKYNMEELIDKPLVHHNISKNTEIDYRDFYNDADKEYVRGAFDERIKQLEDKFGIRYTFENIIERI